MQLKLASLKMQLTLASLKDAAGPLTERWLNLRSKEELVKLRDSFGILKLAAEDGTKKDLVAAIMRSVKPPAELLKPKKPKN